MDPRKNIQRILISIALVLCNVALIVTAVVFTVVYSRTTRDKQEKIMLDNFCNTMETMKQISQNHFDAEFSIVTDWSAYISEKQMTKEEALGYIREATAEETQEAHIVDMDTYEAWSTATTDGSNEIITYSYFNSADNVDSYDEFIRRMNQVFNGAKSILGRYRLRESQRIVVSAGIRVPLSLPGGESKDYLLLRIIPIDNVKKLWVFPTAYDSMEVGLVAANYDYVIPSYAMRSENFIEFVRYYNFGDNPEQADAFLSQMQEQSSGLMTLNDSRGKSCYWYYSRLEDFVGLDIMGYIPVASLQAEGNDLFIVAVVAGIMALLILADGAYILGINRRLKETAEAAKQASYLKTRFLSTMSHDIRTPLNAVLGMTELAQRNIDDPAYVRECLRKISVSGNHLLTLINDILEISRVESGKVSITPAPFNVKEFVDGLEVIIRSQAVGHGLTFDVCVDPLPYECLSGDRLRLSQVYLNLLNNAVKYTPPGGSVRLEVREETQENNRSVLLVAVVADTGSGMSPEFQKTMYESFMRAMDSRISRVQGTGLGLTIVKRMVDLMNGTIDCRSEVNKGTEFTVKIPLEISGEALPSPAGTTEEAQPKNGDLEGLRVLIAEDNEINWEIISMLLQDYGIRCDRAENGKICLDMLSAAAPGTYDLVLMDVQMPVMNGLEATRALRGSDSAELKNIPVLAMTADAFAEDIQRCLDAGMDAHVSKPVETEKVLAAIRLLISRKNNADGR